MKKLLFLYTIILILSASCKKDKIEPEDPDPVVPVVTVVTPAMARDTLYYVMKEWYLWYNLMPTVTRENYADPYELMTAMRYKDLDRWSFVMDYDEFYAQMQGTFVGHGFRIGLDASGNARIAMIYSGSALYTSGVRRGWIVKKINSTEIAPILISGDGAAYSSLIGPSEAGITNIFLFKKPDGSEVTISATKSSFTINPVLLYDTLNLSSGKTGLLVFESFVSPATNALATAFAFFKVNGVKDLILDLRYNPGGDVAIAQTLASYIAGQSWQGTVFAKLQYNNKHQDANYTYNFRTITNSLSLTRLVVITSRSTASASEAVINGVKPLMKVVTLGDTTDGKPTGMNGWDVAKKYSMWPVTFKVVNSANEGEYFEGIFPAKVLPDDITRDFNDRDEICLKEAIHYLETGSVSTKGITAFKRYPQFSEKPSWMNNTFVLEKK